MGQAEKDAPKQNGEASAKTVLTAEQRRQLLTLHMSKLRAKLGEIDELRAPLKDAQEEFTALINEAKADLGKGYTRKYLLTLLEDTTTRLRNLIEEEERRARDREALGLPVFGVQADLFDNAANARMPEEARDEIRWEAEGFMRGRNGALEELPEGCPPRFHQAVLRGYEKGQELTRQEFVAAQELKKTLAEPAAEQAPVDLDDGAGEPEPTIADEKLEEQRAVRRAKASLEALGQPANEVAA